MGAEKRGGSEWVYVLPRFIKHNAFKMPGKRRLAWSPSLGLPPDWLRWRPPAGCPGSHWPPSSGLSGLCTEKHSRQCQVRVSLRRRSGKPHEPASSSKADKPLSSSPVSPGAGHGTLQESVIPPDRRGFAESRLYRRAGLPKRTRQ